MNTDEYRLLKEQAKAEHEDALRALLPPAVWENIRVTVRATPAGLTITRIQRIIDEHETAEGAATVSPLEP